MSQGSIVVFACPDAFRHSVNVVIVTAISNDMRKPLSVRTHLHKMFQCFPFRGPHGVFVFAWPNTLAWLRRKTFPWAPGFHQWFTSLSGPGALQSLFVWRIFSVGDVLSPTLWLFKWCGGTLLALATTQHPCYQFPSASLLPVSLVSQDILKAASSNILEFSIVILYSTRFCDLLVLRTILYHLIT